MTLVMVSNPKLRLLSLLKNLLTVRLLLMPPLNLLLSNKLMLSLQVNFLSLMMLLLTSVTSFLSMIGSVDSKDSEDNLDFLLPSLSLEMVVDSDSD